MEYIVGVWSDEVSLAPIISGEGLELTKNYGSYVGVDCKDRSDVFMLSDVLSDVVIENGGAREETHQQIRDSYNIFLKQNRF